MLTFEIQGTAETFSFEPRRVVIAGYTGRDQAAVRRHIDELREHGIPAPARTPTLFSCTVDRLTIEREIEVLGDRTSGEAEFVLIHHEGRVYVAAGSDHTDRELEKASITFAKQVCPKPISREVWPYEDVRDGWDRIVLRGLAAGRPTDGDTAAGDGMRRYQEGALAEMLRPEDLQALIRERLGGELDGTIVFGGTMPILDEGSFAFGAPFRAELHDVATGRSLTCSYTVREVALADDG